MVVCSIWRYVMKRIVDRTNSEIDNAVKIQGTNYDRKRKVTKDMKRRMQQMYDSGKSYYYIADYYGVSLPTVKYNLDEEFKKESNERRNNYARNWKPTNETYLERVDYKRELLRDKNFRREVPVNF